MASVWHLDPSPNIPVSTGVWIGVGGTVLCGGSQFKAASAPEPQRKRTLRLPCLRGGSGLGRLSEGFLRPGAALGRKGVAPVWIRRLLSVWSGEASGYVRLHSIYLAGS